VQEAQLDAFKEILRRCVVPRLASRFDLSASSSLDRRDRLLAENEALRAGANPPRTAVTVDLTAPSAPDHDLTPAPVDTTTNVLFCHQGQQDIKEVHWHPQAPGVVVSTASDGFNIFRALPFSS